MDSFNTISPACPTTAHIDSSSKPPQYNYNQVSAADLESQNTQWSAPPPPAYWPGQQPPPVPVRVAIQQQAERRRTRKRLSCCIFLAFLLVTIFIVVTIIEVIARYVLLHSIVFMVGVLGYPPVV